MLKIVYHPSRSKNHYGDLLKKKMSDKDQLRKMRQKQEDHVKAVHQESLLYMMIFIGGLFLFCIVNGTSDYDRDLISKKEQNRNND